MGTLNITEIKKSEAEQLNNFDISLKIDGCLIYYKDKKLFSPRCERSERFKHILNILNDNNFPNCMGEVFVDKPNSCVFDVSRKENWDKCKFYIFDLLNNSCPFSQRKEILMEKIKQLNNNFIVPMKRFNSFKEGWDFVVANNSEGLVLRNENNWLKCKLLKEEKIEIVAHEVGKVKGTFILKDGNRVSGTSEQFVIQYLDIKNKGKIPMMEVEFPFRTKEGKMFQPRCRKVYVQQVGDNVKAINLVQSAKKG